MDKIIVMQYQLTRTDHVHFHGTHACGRKQATAGGQNKNLFQKHRTAEKHPVAVLHGLFFVAAVALLDVVMLRGFEQGTGGIFFDHHTLHFQMDGHCTFPLWSPR